MLVFHFKSSARGIARTKTVDLQTYIFVSPLFKKKKNVFSTEVADFGLSVKPGGVGIENMMTEACGTLIYMGMSPVSHTLW